MDLGDYLMGRVREGDEQAFAQLVERYAPPLIAYLRRQSGDRELAQDLAQECFVRVYRRRERYQARGRFQAYLYRIARNLWRDSLRRRQAPAALAHEPEDVRDGPPRALALRELAGEAEAAVARLPEPQREVFELRHRDGLRLEEIARLLEIPAGTARSRLHYALRRLRGDLEARGLCP